MEHETVEKLEREIVDAVAYLVKKSKWLARLLVEDTLGVLNQIDVEVNVFPWLVAICL